MAKLHLLLSALYVCFFLESSEEKSLPSFIALLEDESRLMDPVQSYLSSGILLSLRQSENSQEAIDNQPSMPFEELHESSGDGESRSLMDSENTIHDVQASEQQQKHLVLLENVKESYVKKPSIPLNDALSNRDGKSSGDKEYSGDGESSGNGESSEYGKSSGERESSGDGESAEYWESSGNGESSGDRESSGDGESSAYGESSGNGESSGDGEYSGEGESSEDEEPSGDGDSFGDGKYYEGGESSGYKESSQSLDSMDKVDRQQVLQNQKKYIALLRRLQHLIDDRPSISLIGDFESSGDGETRSSIESFRKIHHPRSFRDQKENSALLENLGKDIVNKHVKTLYDLYESSGDGASSMSLDSINIAGYSEESEDQPKGLAIQDNLQESIVDDSSETLNDYFQSSVNEKLRPSLYSLNNLQDNRSIQDQQEEVAISNNHRKRIVKRPSTLIDDSHESSEDGESRSSLDFIDTSDDSEVSRDLQEALAISETSAEDFSNEESRRSYNEVGEYVYSDESGSYPSLFENSDE